MGAACSEPFWPKSSGIVQGKLDFTFYVHPLDGFDA
jgi:hypothetical protein